MKIVGAYSKVLFDLDRKFMKDKKTSVACIGLAQEGSSTSSTSGCLADYIRIPP